MEANNNDLLKKQLIIYCLKYVKLAYLDSILMLEKFQLGY